jgi:hypothetical protein
VIIPASVSYLVGFAADNPWPIVALVIALVVIVGVMLPAVWSRHPWRRDAAADLTRAICDAVTRFAPRCRRLTAGKQFPHRHRLEQPQPVPTCREDRPSVRSDGAGVTLGRDAITDYPG